MWCTTVVFKNDITLSNVSEFILLCSGADVSDMLVSIIFIWNLILKNVLQWFFCFSFFVPSSSNKVLEWVSLLPGFTLTLYHRQRHYFYGRLNVNCKWSPKAKLLFLSNPDELNTIMHSGFFVAQTSINIFQNKHYCEFFSAWFALTF